MLDYLIVFARGGAVLWTFGQLLNVKGNPIESLIDKCLLEDRAGETSYVHRPPGGTAHTMRWVLHNGLGLVFVAVYQTVLSLPYVDTFLGRLRDEFVTVYRPNIFQYPQFDSTCRALLQKVERHAMTSKMRQQGRNGPAQANGRGGTEAVGNLDDEHEKVTSEGAAKAGRGEADCTDTQADEGSDNTAFDLETMLRKRPVPNRRSKKSPAKPASKSPAKPEKGKKPRKWGEGVEDAAALDLSGAAGSVAAASNAAGAPVVGPSRMDLAPGVTYDDADDAALEAALGGTRAAGSPAAPPGGLLSEVLSTIRVRVLGKEALTADDVRAAVAAMQQRLQQRNVSADVASQICASVAARLEGSQLASLTGVTAAVRGAMEQAISRVLAPRGCHDVLADVRAAQARGRPYSIAFVGVNGVGKSTNLAKVAYWLRQQQLRVMIAACDTFRSGAVEQLRTHCNRLGVPLYERGYERDPTAVAGEALRAAARDGVDVVLIDTAGRMQDNAPLMHALSQLINRNSPDLVLFVGEALVGNDGVNQLVKFNERLADLAPPGQHARLIDGILVTKFDAIDDKVGAVLSMAYASGAPVMFVGCGQTYVDLMRLDVKAVVKALLR